MPAGRMTAATYLALPKESEERAKPSERISDQSDGSRWPGLVQVSSASKESEIVAGGELQREAFLMPVAVTPGEVG